MPATRKKAAAPESSAEGAATAAAPKRRATTKTAEVFISPRHSGGEWITPGTKLSAKQTKALKDAGRL